LGAAIYSVQTLKNKNKQRKLPRNCFACLGQHAV